MKKIKFRAWNKKFNKYHYFNGIFNEQPWTETSTFAQYESCPELHEVDVEQFTGLLDKNGKEIYEGDIVSIDGGADPCLAKIIFQNGCFGLDMKAAKGEYHFAELKYYIDMNFCETEIISNIHENLELIEPNEPE